MPLSASGRATSTPNFWSAFQAPLPWLFVLYFVQGLPFGFQVSALPILLRESGISLTAIGAAAWLALPWTAKVLWAPFVDRYYSRRLGRRRSWILPMQVSLALACLGLGFAPPLTPLLGVVFLSNLLAATLDIAVDGLAVDTLQEQQLGLGNIAQVVGFKTGMLTSGGLLLRLVDSAGWEALGFSMAAMIGIAFVVTLAHREPAARSASAESVEPTPHAMKEAVVALLRRKETMALVAIVATYKLGETFADAMFRPFLVDRGYSAREIGTWVGTWGMAASLLGSVAGGLLASRLAPSLFTALVLTAAVRCLPLVWQLVLALDRSAGPAMMIGATVSEHFFGGALTTAMFAFMMSRVDPRIGGTHFTLLASIEAVGKMAVAPVAGVLAERSGYVSVFAVATALSILYLPLLHATRRFWDSPTLRAARQTPTA